MEMELETQHYRLCRPCSRKLPGRRAELVRVPVDSDPTAFICPTCRGPLCTLNLFQYRMRKGDSLGALAAINQECEEILAAYEQSRIDEVASDIPTALEKGWVR